MGAGMFNSYPLPKCVTDAALYIEMSEPICAIRSRARVAGPAEALPADSSE